MLKSKALSGSAKFCYIVAACLLFNRLLKYGKKFKQSYLVFLKFSQDKCLFDNINIAPVLYQPRFSILN